VKGGEALIHEGSGHKFEINRGECGEAGNGVVVLVEGVSWRSIGGAVCLALGSTAQIRNNSSQAFLNSHHHPHHHLSLSPPCYQINTHHI
jgi:hypothetical protein